MRVMKFGGTSLATGDRLTTVLDLITAASTRERVVVVTSALAGVTDQLTDFCAHGVRTPHDLIEALTRSHLDLWGHVEPEGEPPEGEFRRVFGELRGLAEEVGRLGAWAPEARDHALAFGERGAALLLASLLESRGSAARTVDGGEIIRTDSSFGAATVDHLRTKHLARWTLGRLSPSVIPIVAGFTGSDKRGRTTILGRGSSDLTASLVAAALEAGEVEIWTDVSGIYDRDPNLNANASVLPHLSYGQARALAENGAKVIHPRALDPIEPLRIPLRVRNTLRPEEPGSRVLPETSLRPEGLIQKRISLVIAGPTGGVGKAFLIQLQGLSASLKADGIEVRVIGAFSTRSQAWNRHGIGPGDVLGSLAVGPPTDWAEVLGEILTDPPENPVFVDCTASQEVSALYLPLLTARIPVVTPNKLAGSGSLNQYHSIQKAARGLKIPFRYETTVGAALPILRTVRELRQGGDRLRSVGGVLSGTLSFLFGKMAEGFPFSQAVREAWEQGYTEPHPREDLGGRDVARKLLILLREAGVEMEPEAISVESLVPEQLSNVDAPEEFLEKLQAFDGEWAQRVEEARGRQLGYIAWYDGTRARVGVEALPSDHPLADLKPTENRVVLNSDRYPEVPLTIAGPGAGREITAAGVLADVLDAIREIYGNRRVA